VCIQDKTIKTIYVSAVTSPDYAMGVMLTAQMKHTQINSVQVGVVVWWSQQENNNILAVRSSEYM